MMTLLSEFLVCEVKLATELKYAMTWERIMMSQEGDSIASHIKSSSDEPKEK